ncbi:beta-glucoside-specific PTS transporter subunit IIABC [Breznakia pachnodae]|uniref:PTS system beta-glucosides-specific IIC component n=1 Tax=Breznakia pachnodae TaxID=265178 RepID=A0ABU0E2G8_9FIRM|nr:beta-glucoside-specific PTS transporter subunit IIABC [Breznakia pachnodae]MDQ0360695.1 PTS system beta-glucosides-specific IIC component [Breznakia pachnodae]
MNFKETAKTIINLVGGQENIISLTYCVTRLRFELKDQSKANIKELEDTDGVIVIGIVSTDMLFQIIIGTEVAHVYDEIINQTTLINKNTKSSTKKMNPFKTALDLLINGINPIIPLFMISGVLTALLTVLKLTGILQEDSSTYIVLSAIQTSIFFFLPIFIANAVALKLNTNPYLAMALATVLVSTSINGVEGLGLFGVGVPTVTYSNSILPIIMAVWFMSFIEKKTEKYINEKIRFIIQPVFLIVITLSVTLFIFGPLGTWVGNGLGYIFDFIGNTVGYWLVIPLTAIIYPFLIISGTAGFMIPIIFTNLAELGYDPLISPIGQAADMAVAGATLAIALRAHKTQVKQLAFATGTSALLGVTEPANYGVLMKYKRPYVATAIGGGLGGLFAGIFGLRTYALTSSIIGLPAYIAGENPMGNFYVACGTVAISFGVSFLISYFYSLTPENNPKNGMLDTFKVFAPITGKVIPLSEVNDRVFSSESIGKGIAIKPKSNVLVAPFDAIVTTLFPTNHAIGLTTEDGLELLIHIGIDTVNLNGKWFNPKIKAGEKVTAGQTLIEFDYEEIEKEGYDNVVMFIVTNTDDYKNVITVDAKDIKVNELMLSIEIKEAS